MTKPATLRLLAALLLCALSARPALSQVNMWTANGRDGVQIFKITPRTYAEVPLPLDDFVVYLQLKVKLDSTAKGTVEVTFSRFSPARQLKAAPVAPPIRREIARGGQYITLESAPIKLPAAHNDEQLLVKAVLRDGRGAVVSWSESANRLRGTVTIRPSGTSAKVDSVEVLGSTSPQPGSVLRPGSNNRFVIRLNYNVKSRRRAIINVEFGDASEIRQGKVWATSVIEVPQGTGQVEVTRNLFIPAMLVGTTMAIGLPLRLDPLGGSATMPEIKPYTIGR